MNRSLWGSLFEKREKRLFVTPPFFEGGLKTKTLFLLKKFFRIFTRILKISDFEGGTSLEVPSKRRSLLPYAVSGIGSVATQNAKKRVFWCFGGNPKNGVFGLL